MIKSVRIKLVVVFAVVMMMTGCGNSTDSSQNKDTNTVNSTENISNEVDSEEGDASDLQEETASVVTPEVDARVAPEEETESTESNDSDEPIWIEDELKELAVNELGADKVENVAADAFTVKYLIDEPEEENAWLEQYSILYRMKDDYNLTVKFVFYSEKGNSSSAYLKTEYSADTLKNLDLDSISDFNDLKNYVE